MNASLAPVRRRPKPDPVEPPAVLPVGECPGPGLRLLDAEELACLRQVDDLPQACLASLRRAFRDDLDALLEAAMTASP